MGAEKVKRSSHGKRAYPSMLASGYPGCQDPSLDADAKECFQIPLTWASVCSVSPYSIALELSSWDCVPAMKASWSQVGTLITCQGPRESPPKKAVPDPHELAPTCTISN